MNLEKAILWKEIQAVVLAVMCCAQCAFIAAVGVEACKTPAILTPPSTTGCHLNEHECSDHGCCLEYDSCGGDDPSCPKDSCCYVGGPPEFMSRSDASTTRVMRPKRRL